MPRCSDGAGARSYPPHGDRAGTVPWYSGATPARTGPANSDLPQPLYPARKVSRRTVLQLWLPGPVRPVMLSHREEQPRGRLFV
jgi:hypothetical protein